MTKIIMLRGLPASGKSSWAREYVKKNTGWKRINKDDLRNMLDAGEWSKQNEKFVLEARDTLLRKCLSEGMNVIVDDTNFFPKHESDLRLIAAQFDAEFSVQEFDADVEELIKRDMQRPNSVGERVIRDMHKRYIAPKDISTAPIHDPNLPNAIICDLDGTIALLNGRNPYDASTCENDPLNIPVASIVEGSQKMGRELIFVSGREDKYRNETDRWLLSHGLGLYMSLLMRPAGDARKDAIVKRELYEKYIAGRFNVAFVLDDRNQVVDMWRSLGLTCLQVAPGDF